MAAKLLGGVNGNAQRAQNFADGSSATDLVTLQQMQAAVRGLNWKQSVRIATTGNGTLSSSFANGQSVDGVTLATGDRILIKNQTTQSENGIYTVNASGAPTRAVDADSSTELDGAAVYVTSGTAGHDTAWTQQTDAPTIGSSNIVFNQFGGGAAYSAGNGLSLASTTFSILLDSSSGMIVSGSGLKIDTSVVVRKYAANCAATTNPQTFTHNLGSLDVHVTVIEVSSGIIVYADVTASSTSDISVDFGGAPTSSQYRVIVFV